MGDNGDRILTIVLANFDEVFNGSSLGTASPGGRGLWQKALVRAERGTVVLVAPDLPSNADPIEGAWRRPTEAIVPRFHSGQVTRDLLEDEKAWERLRNLVRQADSIEVLFQVYSMGVMYIIDRLDELGVPLEERSIPCLSPRTVLFWSSKLGGHELMQSIPDLRRSLPPAMLANSESELVSLVQGGDASQGFIAKPNISAGGLGMRLFLPFTDRTQIDGSSYVSSSKTSGQLSADSLAKGPFLVEMLMGDHSQNRSITYDFEVMADGYISRVGMGQQLLTGGLGYRGCIYSSTWSRSPLDQECTRLGGLIGCELHRRGFRGLFNADFIITPHDEVFVVEINVRQSAPLDQFLIMRRLYGDKWTVSASFACEEDIQVPACIENIQQLRSELILHMPEDSAVKIIPLSIYERPGSSVKRASIMAATDAAEAPLQTLAMIRTCIADQEMDQDVTS